MKTLTTLLVLFSVSFLTSAQGPQMNDQIINEDEQAAQLEKKVMESCELLLNTPVNKKDENRINASQLIIQWMESTPDYSFSIDENIYTLTKSNASMLNVYLASLVKATLDNINPYENEKEVKMNCVNTFLDYCSTPKNKLKPNKGIKKMLEARDSGTLTDYLALK